MLFSKSFKVVGSIAMSAMLTNMPAVALAEPGMIPTHVAAEALNRAQALQNVNEFLSRSDVQKIMTERGLSTEEASLRLASLSESELRQLSSQVSEARAGGDILVAILLVVLIIFLIKRL